MGWRVRFREKATLRPFQEESEKDVQKGKCSGPLIFPRSAQKRADNLGRHAHDPHLYDLRPFAKWFVSIMRVLRVQAA
jgi:hypothetical protein